MDCLLATKLRYGAKAKISSSDGDSYVDYVFYPITERNCFQIQLWIPDAMSSEIDIEHNEIQKIILNLRMNEKPLKTEEVVSSSAESKEFVSLELYDTNLTLNP